MTSPRPEFIRIPRGKELCPHTGFTRTGLYRLTVPCKANNFKPAVPAKCLRKSGNLRGIWLIPFEPLMGCHQTGTHVWQRFSVL